MNHERTCQEVDGQRPFIVEVGNLENLEDIYYAIGHIIKIGPSNQIVKIGTSHSEDELFSTIDIEAITNGDGCSIRTILNYENPKYQYWPESQVEQLQGLLTNKCGYNTEHKLEDDCHSIIIKHSDGGLLCTLNLGYEDEKTAWKNQVKAANEALTRLKDNPEYNIIQRQIERILRHITDEAHPIIASTIIIKRLDLELFPSSIEEFAGDLEKMKIFKDAIRACAQFTENAVNEIANVKGIPQSGKIMILPPSEIPQV